MSISIHELLAVARESEGVKAVKGDAMLCEKRFAPSTEYSCAVTPQVRQTGNRLSGLAGTAYASLLT